MQDFQYAVKEKVTPDHDVIDEAIREKAEGYTVFSIPVGVVYRPNEAKVKNLKTKDYLGKARLVAASDRSNAFTGFAGSEKKNMIAQLQPQDDRPQEAISYAATNLVQRNLTSKRQQSEPPINRNMFPPTPPPENDKPASMTGRAASVRNPPNRPIQRTMTDVSMADPLPPPPRNMMSPPQSGDRPMRMGTQRTASEPRGPPSRQYSRNQNRPQLYRETTNNSRGGFDAVQEDNMYDDVYDMYQSPRSSRGGAARRRPVPTRRGYYDDNTGMDEDEMYEDDDIDDGDFEMMSSAPSPLRSNRRAPPAEVRKIRVKVHAEGDTRYIMIGPAVEYGDFEGRIREKFGIKTRLKVMMRDEGDMITMGDQDDLDMLITTAKQGARRERSDMGKMEVGSPRTPFFVFFPPLSRDCLC